MKNVFLKCIMPLLLAILLATCALCSCKREQVQEPAPQPPETVTTPDPLPSVEPGLYFSANERYYPGAALSALPLTLEATLTVPTDAADRRGVVFGNDDGHASCLVLTVEQNGRPCVFLRAAGVSYTCLFDSVDVRGEAVRLSIVWDVSAGQMHCYLNGQLKQTYTGALPTDTFAPTQGFVLGGDLTLGGTDYFKDALQSFAAWSDVRTPAEVAAAEYDAADGALLLAYDFVEGEDVMLDLSTHQNDLVCEPLWMDVSAMQTVGDYAYSFAVIGDLGGMVGQHGGKLSLLYDWLLDNKDAQKIAHVLGLGGMTATDADGEWSLIAGQTQRLNGQISYTLVRGEQDSAAKMNAALGADYAASLQGVMVEGDVTNAYTKLTVGGHKYLILMLDVGASDAVLAWAGDVIAANTDHRVIVTTHIYQYHDGSTLDGGDAAPATDYVTGNNGDAIFEKLISKHENIVLVLSSHDAWQSVVCSQVKGDAGNTITQIMVSPQGLDAHVGATGMVAMLYFGEDGDRITVRYYSTARGQYGADTAHFTVALVPGDGESEE